VSEAKPGISSLPHASLPARALTDLLALPGPIQEPRPLASSRASGRSLARDYLLSVSGLTEGTEHPLLCASADDFEARPGGKPIQPTVDRRRPGALARSPPQPGALLIPTRKALDS